MTPVPARRKFPWPLFLLFLRTRMFYVLALALWLPAVGRPALTSAEIDAMLERAQRDAGVEPAPLADDAAFLRRLSLDVRGVVPTVEETIGFLKDESPGKRAAWIDKFLESPQRGEHWAAYWDKVLVGTLEQPQAAAAQQALKEPFRAWVAEQFNANAPYDEFMRAVVAARGQTNEVPEVLPLARWRDAPESMAGSMSRAFLGTQIQCAQCHDHKSNADLTQRKFWEFAAFFSNTRGVPIRNNEMMPRIPGLDVREAGFRWEMPIPDLEPAVMVTPKYLDGTAARQEVVDEQGRMVGLREQRQALRHVAELRQRARQQHADPQVVQAMVEQARAEIPPMFDTRREQLARLILRRDADQFAGNLVNRAWARFFGRGLLEPVDGWDTGIEADHPELLAALAAQFRESGHDVRALERLLLNTNAYQRSSRPTETSAEYPDLFAHAAVRPLGPEQLLRSIVQATSVEAIGGGRNRGGQQFERLRNAYAAQFLHTFGNDEMEWTNTFETSIPRALFLLNDEGINGVLRGDSSESTIARIAATTSTPAEQARYLYMAALSRMPSDAERQALAHEISAAGNTGSRDWRAFMEDAFWALINSTEFLTNH